MKTGLRLLLPLLLLLAAGAWWGSRQGLLPSGASPGRPTVSVLFIGASFTRFNDLPQMLPQIAASNPDEKLRFKSAMAAVNGGRMAALSRNRPVLSALRGKHYDAVLLQEDSSTFLHASEVPASVRGLTSLINAVQETGAVPFIFSTWPWKRGHANYSASITPDFTPPIGPEDMASIMDRHLGFIAESAGANYISVGHHFARAELENNRINLYHPDGRHPSVHGSYLAALRVYAALSGNSPAATTWKPPGITEEEARFLRSIAARGV